MRVALCFEQSKPRYIRLYQAWKQGIAASGHSLTHGFAADLIIAWGLSEANKELIIKANRLGKQVLLMDFGYWDRYRYTKVSLGSIHPTQFMTSEIHNQERYQIIGGACIQPWRAQGDHILLAGMGPKGCQMYGYRHGEWDAWAVAEIQKHTNRPILYKPKASDHSPKIPKGVIAVNQADPLSKPLEDCWLMVTHHGNSFVEAITSGIPTMCKDGPFSAYTTHDFSQVEQPPMPEREPILYNLAHWMWNNYEIAAGLPFESLCKRGLIRG